MSDTPQFESQAEEIRRLADDGLGGLASIPEIEASLQTEFSNMSIVITDPGDIPADASIRPNGAFADPYDLKEYLDEGGLLTYDQFGNAIPFPWVYSLAEWDEYLQTYVWQVYIRETSE